ncbi:P-loop containing nucleoside triphosphate hydrolases superfamily protein isoform X2 [Wolffia australiana]
MAGEIAKGKQPIGITTGFTSQDVEFGAKSDDSRSAQPKSYVRMQSRNASSKYDFVKVKVWLGDNADHYYVLSRFLLSRMLTVTKIPNHVAIKIALELKKLLIDNSLLDVSQNDLEFNLFKLMERRGYGKEYIDRYKMMTEFHHQRVPLVILVCGTACTGKSTIATQLAQRLNLPNVLQTDMVYELLRTSTDAPLTSVPVWAREFSSPEELITEFCRECRVVWKGLAGDLKKAMKDGKPIIIEGVHLDPSIYLMNEENRGLLGLPRMKNPVNSQTTLEKMSLRPIGQNKGNINPERDITCSANMHYSEDKDISGAACRVISEPAIESDRRSDLSGEILENRDLNIESLVRKGKRPFQPIIVPIVLKMAEFDHKALLEEWVASRTIGDKDLVQDQDNLIRNLKTVQDYLCSFESQGLMVVNISATTFPQTLDRLHNYLLQCIEEGVSSTSESQ